MILLPISWKFKKIKGGGGITTYPPIVWQKFVLPIYDLEFDTLPT